MEINPLNTQLNIINEHIPVETKPLKGDNFDNDVRRFEEIILKDNLLKTEVVDDLPSVQDIFLNAMGDMKKGLDNRANTIDRFIQVPDGEINMVDVAKIQWQIALYGVECNLVSKSGDKVSSGIQTLFRNQ